MTWDTESVSDAQSQSQMTTDTYGYTDNGSAMGGGDDQNIIWSDDPETAYLRLMIQQQGHHDDRSLIGDSTINEMLQERGHGGHRGGGDETEDDNDDDDDNSNFHPTGNTPTSRTQNTRRNSNNTSNDRSFEPMIDSSGLSYYDTDGDDDTIAHIQADADDSGWFAARRKKFDTNHPAPNNDRFLNPLPLQPLDPSPRVAYNIKSPLSALSPQDKAGDGNNGMSHPGFAVPNPLLVPTSPGKRPVGPGTPAKGNAIMADLEGYTEDGKIIPGYIFVTAGHSSAVQTKDDPNSKKKNKKQQQQQQLSDATPKRSRFTFGRGSRTPKASNRKLAAGEGDDDNVVAPKKSSSQQKAAASAAAGTLTVDTRTEAEERRRRRKYFLCKIGLAFLLMAIAVGIAMLSIVFKSKRSGNGTSGDGSGSTDGEASSNLDVGPPTMSPNFFVPPAGTPTAIPTSPLGGWVVDGADDTATPTVPITAGPTAVPTPLPSVTTLAPTGVPVIETAKTFLVTQFPDSAVALADTTSPQYRALEWITQDMMVGSGAGGGGNRRHGVRGRDRVLQENDDMDWRFVQRWTLGVLYFATGGNLVDDSGNTTDTTTTGWISAAGWLELPEECQWAFVTCDANGRVGELLIRDNSLVGTIPAEIGLLGDALTLLSLDANELVGTLPTTIGLLKGVNRLALIGNQLTDQLPTEMGDMTALTFLELSRNLFNGPIPSELGNVAGLTTIDLARTNVKGTLPTELGRLQNLEMISLGSTSVSGTFPTEMGALPLLTDIKVARTDLVGSMPDGVCNRDPSELDEIKADCLEIDCPCCTTCCDDSGGCTGATPSPTEGPTRDPTQRPTQAPTAQTTPSPTTAPVSIPETPPPTTPEPTIEVVTATTESPTRSPTFNPTDRPTSAPVPMPTEPPTLETAPPMTAPVGNPTGGNNGCGAEISTDRTCYENGSDVVVSFTNCNARFDDWIGVYSVGTDFTLLAEPTAWVWTAGDQFMQSPVASGTVTFFQAQGSGDFQAVIARNREGPPYRAYGVSNEFTLTNSCS